ncbi:MAG: hypothetical protein K0S55_1665 [Clostridia bacterium]|nr:hypothetical protein [Clostridia bacterium]
MTLFGAIWMFVLFLTANGFTFELSAISIFYAFIYSVISILCNTSSFFAMTLGKVSTVTLYMLLGGLILPFFYGIIFLNEILTVFKVLGIFLMFLSVFLPMLLDKKTDKEQQKSKKIAFTVLCILVFILNGLISIVSKAHQINEQAVGTVDFLILTAVISFTITFVLILILTIKNKKQNKFIEAALNGVGKAFTLKWITIMFCISGAYIIMNGLGNIFSLTCAITMDSSIQFPVISGAVVTLTALLSWIFFKESIKKLDALGIAFAIAGIIMFII